MNISKNSSKLLPTLLTRACQEAGHYQQQLHNNNNNNHLHHHHHTVISATTTQQTNSSNTSNSTSQAAVMLFNHQEFIANISKEYLAGTKTKGEFGQQILHMKQRILLNKFNK